MHSTSKSKPMIKRNEATQKLEAGFMDSETGIFSPVSEVEQEDHVKEFMKAYGLSVVFNSIGL